jgi:hypothetical protein
MKFQEGDKIVVSATQEKGVVVEWISKKMLTIEVDGVSFPVHADQIDFPYFADFSSPKVQTKKKVSSEIPRREKKPEKIIERDGVLLSLYPVLDKDIFDDDIISHFKIYLLNHTDDGLGFNFSLFINSLKEIELKSSVRALDELYLIDLSLEKLNDHPKFSFVFELTEKNNLKASSFNHDYKPKAKQIFKIANEVLKLQKASFTIQLFENYPLKGSEIENKLPEQEEEEDGNIDLKKLILAGFKVKKK